MGVPKSGQGFQTTDGNLNEPQIFPTAAPATATATASLTVAQLLNGTLVANPSTSAASYTLPTVAALEADSALGVQKVGTTFEVVVVNLGTSSGAVTVVTNTGWTLVGNMVVAITSSARFRGRKTGDGAWTLYRV